MRNTVLLPPDCLHDGALEGATRYWTRKDQAQRQSYSARPRKLEVDVAGAVAEVAMAYHLGLRWNQCNGVQDYDLPDVGDCIEVRNRMQYGNPLQVTWQETKAQRLVLFTVAEPRLGRVTLTHAYPATWVWDQGVVPNWGDGPDPTKRIYDHQQDGPLSLWTVEEVLAQWGLEVPA